MNSTKSAVVTFIGHTAYARATEQSVILQILPSSSNDAPYSRETRPIGVALTTDDAHQLISELNRALLQLESVT
jgi:hypothetical protein